MKKSFKRVMCVFLAVLMALTFPACKKKDKVSKFEPEFKVKPYEGEEISFKIPNDWGQIADPSGAGILVFAGREAYEEGGFNNVSVCVYDTQNPAATIADVEVAFKEDFETQVKIAHPDATEFTYDSFATEQNEVFVAQYNCSALGKNLTQKIYYPLVDNMQIYIAACDTAVEGILADDVAKEIVHTLIVGTQGEESKAK